MKTLAQPRFPGESLIGVSETLLMPLVARANAHRSFPQLRFRDVYSELMLQALDVDVERFRRDGSMLGSCLRARWIENEAIEFLGTRPDALGVSLGAGLDTLYLRLCDGIGDIDNYWYDVDVPAVIGLKRHLLTETERYRMLAADLVDPLMIERLVWKAGQPALFIAEGVLMDMPRVDVEALLSRLIAAAAWRQSTISVIFDFCSPLMAQQFNRYPSVRRTSAVRRSGRPLQWSLEHPQELQWLHPDLRICNTYDLMRDCGVVPRLLSWMHRRLTGRLFYGCVHMQFHPSS